MPRRRQALTVADLYDPIEVQGGPIDEAHDEAIENGNAQLLGYLDHLKVTQGVQKVSFNDGRPVIHIDVKHKTMGEKLTPDEIDKALAAIMIDNPGKVAKILKHNGSQWLPMQTFTPGPAGVGEYALYSNSGVDGGDDDSTYSQVSIMLHDPNPSDELGEGETNDCLWEALVIGTGKPKPLTCAHAIVARKAMDITTPRLFRQWLTDNTLDLKSIYDPDPEWHTNTNPIPNRADIWALIDAGLGETWALHVSGPVPYTSGKTSASRLLRLATTHTHVVAPDYDDQSPDLRKRWRLAKEKGPRDVIVRDASTPQEWIVKPRSSPMLVIRPLANETPAECLARFERDCAAVDALEVPEFEGLNPYRLTGDIGFTARLMFALMAAKNLAEPEPLGYIESIWLRLGMACSLIYRVPTENVDCTMYDQNSAHPAVMCSPTTMPYRAGVFQVQDPKVFDAQKAKGFFPVGIYRLKRAPLFALLGDTGKPLRAKCRGTRGIEANKFAKMLGAEHSEFWVSADLDAALAVLPHEALQLEDDGADNVLLYPTGRVKACDLFGAAARRLYDARKRNPAAKIYKEMLVKACGKLSERNIKYQHYAAGAEGVTLPVSFGDASLIEDIVKNENGDIIKCEYYESRGAPLYREASARALPFIHAASRRAMCKVLAALPVGSVRRIFTDSFVVRSDDEKAAAVARPFLGPDLGAFKMEHAGVCSFSGLNKVKFKDCRMCAGRCCK